MPDVKKTASDPIGSEEGQALFAPLKPYSHLALAVSGGSDSVAMMWLMARWRAQLAGRPSLHILSVDHGLREGAAFEAEQTGEWARALGCEHHTLRWRGVKPQSGIQAGARTARYALMTRWCRANHMEALVVAHHLDDQAETVFMRLMKGSGIDGLCGMRFSGWREGMRLMRPLLDIPKARLVATLRHGNQAWLEDPSNLDMKYERVRIRHILNGLEDEGLSAAKLCASARSLARTRDALDAMANALIEKALIISPGGFCHMDEDGMRLAAEETALRVFRRVLMAVGGGHHPPARSKLLRLFNQVIARGGAGATLAGCTVFRQAGRLWVVRELRGDDRKSIDLAGGQESAWDNRFAVLAPAGDGTGYQVRALGPEGWRLLKGITPDMKPLPAAAGQSLVSFWREGELHAVPFAGYCASGEECGGMGFKAEFFQKKQILLTC